MRRLFTLITVALALAAAARPAAKGRLLVLASDKASVRSTPCTVSIYMTKAKASSQGMDICDSLIFVVADGGTCTVYDYRSATGKALATFDLGSKRAGNHSNCANFGLETAPGASFPALYVSVGKPGDQDEWNVHVESITRQDSTFKSRLIQTICMDQSQYAAHGLQPIWGCPNWVIDKERKALWAFSAIKRTTVAGTGEMSTNRYIATKFRLPALSEGDTVKLTHADVLDQVSFPFDTYVTQGGTMRDGKIWYAYGFGKTGTLTPSRVRVYDTDSHQITARYELESIINEELEDISIYDGHILLNTNSSKIYELTDTFKKTSDK
ncbi:MAG: hypothetical protein PUH21_00840 [Prevotellaceae bacterium]|nr:hypothetical protein [Prevotellaceae bacterium]MDY3857103.1 hypothetical protein [Bacteroidaceae bacterium]